MSGIRRDVKEFQKPRFLFAFKKNHQLLHCVMFQINQISDTVFISTHITSGPGVHYLKKLWSLKMLKLKASFTETSYYLKKKKNFF